MSEKRPLLTISFLSSGRGKTIKRCLDSIVPLMERVDSELIIVDTGCDEEIKALMANYTDQIVPFTWCDDFSKARNAGLEKARGEWFLYLDDDEWFIDTKEIEEFFLSGEYKKYRFANYIQRNYMDYDRHVFTDTWVSRLARLEKNTRFVSAIHEYLHPLYNPCKLLHSTVEHFGYIYASKEEERKHIKRNITLLEKMIDREPDVIRWWIHLLQEYRAAEEYHQMQELCRKGLDQFRYKNTVEVNRDRGAFYCGMIEADLLAAYNEEAEKDLEKAMLDKRNNQMCRMRLNNLGTEIYYKKGEYAKAIECAEKYLEYYKLLVDQEEERQLQETFFVLNAFEPSGLNSTLCYYILCGLHLNNTKILKAHFWEFGWDGMLMLVRGFIGEVVDAMARLPYEDDFVVMAQTMASRDGLDEPWDKIREYENRSGNSPEDEEKFMKLARIFSQVKSKNHYVFYLRILYGVYTKEIDKLDEWYEQIFHRVTDILQLDDAIFDIAEKYHVNLGIQFEKIPFDQWYQGVECFFSNSPYDRIKRRAEVVQRTMPSEGVSDRLMVRYDYFFMKTAEAAVVFGYSRDNLELLQMCLGEFADRCLAFYGHYFKDSAFEGEMELLPPACRAAVWFRRLLEAQSAGDREQIGECLKAAAGTFKYFEGAIKAYANLYAAQEKARLEAAQVSPEMRALAEQIKEKIRVLLGQGMTAEAYQVLQQLKTFTPDDVEIAELEKEITRRFS